MTRETRKNPQTRSDRLRTRSGRIEGPPLSHQSAQREDTSRREARCTLGCFRTTLSASEKIPARKDGTRRSQSNSGRRWRLLDPQTLLNPGAATPGTTEEDGEGNPIASRFRSAVSKTLGVSRYAIGLPDLRPVTGGYGEVGILLVLG